MSRHDDTRASAAGTSGGPILFSDPFPQPPSVESPAEAGGDDERVVYAPAIMIPDGVGATVWSSSEWDCPGQGGTTAAAHLASRFVPYAQCPSHVQAMLVAHANRMLVRLMDDVQRLGGG